MSGGDFTLLVLGCCLMATPFLYCVGLLPLFPALLLGVLEVTLFLMYLRALFQQDKQQPLKTVEASPLTNPPPGSSQQVLLGSRDQEYSASQGASDHQEELGALPSALFSSPLPPVLPPRNLREDEGWGGEGNDPFPTSSSSSPQPPLSLSQMLGGRHSPSGSRSPSKRGSGGGRRNRSSATQRTLPSMQRASIGGGRASSSVSTSTSHLHPHFTAPLSGGVGGLIGQRMAAMGLAGGQPYAEEDLEASMMRGSGINSMIAATLKASAYSASGGGGGGGGGTGPVGGLFSSDNFSLLNATLDMESQVARGKVVAMPSAPIPLRVFSPVLGGGGGGSSPQLKPPPAPSPKAPKQQQQQQQPSFSSMGGGVISRPTLPSSQVFQEAMQGVDKWKAGEEAKRQTEEERKRNEEAAARRREEDRVLLEKEAEKQAAAEAASCPITSALRSFLRYHSTRPPPNDLKPPPPPTTTTTTPAATGTGVAPAPSFWAIMMKLATPPGGAPPPAAAAPQHPHLQQQQRLAWLKALVPSYLPSDSLQSKLTKALDSMLILGRELQAVREDEDALHYVLDCALAYAVKTCSAKWRKGQGFKVGEEPRNYLGLTPSNGPSGESVFMASLVLRHLLTDQGKRCMGEALQVKVRNRYFMLLSTFTPDLTGGREGDRDEKLAKALVSLGRTGVSGSSSSGGGTQQQQQQQVQLEGRGVGGEDWNAFAQGLAVLHAGVLQADTPSDPYTLPFGSVWTLLARWGNEVKGGNGGALSRTRKQAMAALLDLCGWRLREDYGRDKGMEVLSRLEGVREHFIQVKDNSAAAHAIKEALGREKQGDTFNALKRVPAFLKEDAWKEGVARYISE